MPASYVKKVAKDKGKSVSEMENLWTKAKDAAAKEGKANDYAYITGIFKRMAGVIDKACLAFVAAKLKASTLKTTAAITKSQSDGLKQFTNLMRKRGYNFDKAFIRQGSSLTGSIVTLTFKVTHRNSAEPVLMALTDAYPSQVWLPSRFKTGGSTGRNYVVFDRADTQDETAPLVVTVDEVFSVMNITF